MANHYRTLARTDPEYSAFSRDPREIAERYRRPLFVSETGTEGDERPGMVPPRRG